MSKRRKSPYEVRKLSYPAHSMKPEDLLTFVHFPHFVAEWNRLGLNDDDLRALEILIMCGPKQYPMMRGTGGLRKGRFAPSRWNVGKRGALRIGFVFLEQYSVVGLIVAFAKNEQANLTPAERKAIKQLIAAFEASVERGFQPRPHRR